MSSLVELMLPPTNHEPRDATTRQSGGIAPCGVERFSDLADELDPSSEEHSHRFAYIRVAGARSIYPRC